jgi:hypothetical protein
MRFLSQSLNGASLNGVSLNGVALNGLRAPDGLRSSNGSIIPDGNLTDVGGSWNSFFLPTQFSDSVLGTNSIHPDLLGPRGVGGDLSNVPGIENNVLDNRFIFPQLKDMLCLEDVAAKEGGITFRDYFSVLVDLAWPTNAEFWLCCSELAGTNATSHCLEPDFIFSSKPQLEGIDALAIAPHFLTAKFESGQQEALTAALIAKLNVLGKPLMMDLTYRFDLGPAGTRLMGGRYPGFDFYLGNAWGNMFLDCSNADKDNVLCEASTEVDRAIGRDPLYYGLPMFTCDGQSGYPTTESGKSCFSKDMKTNILDGCDFVSAVGPCNQVCVGGFCGVNDPPIEGRGTTNVLYIYMSEYSTTMEDEDESVSNLGLKIALPLVAALAICALVLLAARKVKKAKKKAATTEKNDTGSTKETSSSTDIDTAEDSVTCHIGA